MAFPFPKNLELRKSILRDWISSAEWLLEIGHIQRAELETSEAMKVSNLLPGGRYPEELERLENLFNRINHVYSESHQK